MKKIKYYVKSFVFGYGIGAVVVTIYLILTKVI